ncbi:MAG: phage/plasmid primase, P4 family [Nitrospiraceae bacterium]
MANLLDLDVSAFAGSYNTTPLYQLPLATMLQQIQDGTHQPWISTLRATLAAGDADSYRRQKESSLAFTPCCALTSRAKKVPWHTKLLHTTGLAYYDLDHLPDAEAMKQLLASDPALVFAFISPSGTGLKVGLAIKGITDSQSYKAAWRQGLDHLKQGHPAVHFNEDAQVKFLNALCYVSHDPALYVNPQAVPLVMTPSVNTQKARRPGRLTVHPDYDRVARALEAIPNGGAGVEYDTWLTVAMALHSTGEAWAHDLWDSWSQQSAKYDESKQQKTWNSLESTGAVTVGSLFHLAKQHGWQEDRQERRSRPERPIPDMTGQGGAQVSRPDVPFSDDYNVQTFVQEHGQNVRFCHPWDKWLLWNGSHWQVDASGAAMRLAKRTVRDLGHLALDTEDKELLKHVKKSLSTGNLRALLGGAESERPIQPEDLDQNAWLLNCQNGTLDLRTGQLHAHRREDYLTRRLAIPYDPAATCPTWLTFLGTIMGENKALLTFLQRALGYALTGSTREQCLFVLHGTGANGKSTFLEAVQALLGDYAQSTPSATLLVKDRQDGIPNDVARLRGARLVSAVEIGEGKRLNEELIKRLTGQDTLTARFLFAEFFDFVPEFKLFVACNHLPQIRGNDHAIWRRVKLVPFAVTIPPDKQDKSLPEKLKQELPGILAWAVQGCLAWQQDGLAAPEEVVKATEEYRKDQDRVGQFLEDLCTTDSRYEETTSKLYDAYIQWCKENGENFPLPSKIFGSRLGDQGFTAARIGKARNRGWQGVRLLTHDELELRAFEAAKKDSQEEKTDTPPEEAKADMADMADIKTQDFPREQNTNELPVNRCPPMSAMSADPPLCPEPGHGRMTRNDPQDPWWCPWCLPVYEEESA